jgi:hypothetical protein
MKQMDFKSRKLRVWLVSIGAVLAVYLLYSWISKTPPIDIDAGKKFAGGVADSNIDGLDGGGGSIGDVDVESIRKAKYVHLNEQKQVDREFGFEKLLHKVGEEWDLEKPYMNVFRRSFKCYITSDKGKARVETAAGRPSPKDVTLNENVVIHILPEKDADIKESFIYLDDVEFVSERSQFSTAGPVKFVSEDVQMLGRGLEVVYNEEMDRLEFFRIFHLESLHAKVPAETGLFSPGQTRVDRPADTNSRPKTLKPDESAVADDSQKTKPLPTETIPAVEQTDGEHYRCVFSKNVLIKSPQEWVFADDEVCINNIFRPKVSDKESDKADDSDKAEKTEKAEIESTGGTDNVKADNVIAVKQGEPNESTSAQKFVDIVVTCDGGVVVMPMDSPRISKKPAKSTDEAAGTNNRALKVLKEAKERTVFIAQKIDYCAATGNTVVSGPSELIFYTSDIIRGEAKNKKAENKTIPVKVIARKKAEFFPALNQAVFEGDCVSTMERADPNIQQKYILSAPKLTVNLSGDNTVETTVEHMTADGGPVRLTTVKYAGEKLLGWTTLDCVKLDYDDGPLTLLAIGPGKIALDNSRIAQPKGKVNKFGLRKQCYAIIEDFDTLKFFSKSNRIIADAKAQQIYVGYVPIVEGQPGQAVKVWAGHIDALLYQTPDGRTELSTLTASGGITYKDDDNEFVGSKLFHDASKSIVTIQGDESWPCLLNGVLVDRIEYDPETGRLIHAEIVGPGALQKK